MFRSFLIVLALCLIAFSTPLLGDESAAATGPALATHAGSKITVNYSHRLDQLLDRGHFDAVEQPIRDGLMSSAYKIKGVEVLEYKLFPAMGHPPGLTITSAMKAGDMKFNPANFEQLLAYVQQHFKGGTERRIIFAVGQETLRHGQFAASALVYEYDKDRKKWTRKLKILPITNTTFSPNEYLLGVRSINQG
ncbi:MAG: hypothetical protein JWN18_387 [Parcubacteria group bacterium]|nr:hypothetical protein [Parcubacteria group bacterium]